MKANKNLIMLFTSLIIIALIGLSFTYIYEKNSKEKEAEENNTLEQSYEQSKEETIVDKAKTNIDNTSQINNIEKLTHDVISEFHYLIDNKDFDKAYNMLNSEYVEDFDMTKEKFISLYNDLDKSKYSISEILPQDDSILIKYYNIIDDGSYITQNSSIIFEANEKTITLNGTYNVKEENIKVSNENIDIEIVKSMKIAGDLAYKIIVKNKTKEEIYINNKPMGISGIDSKGNVSEHLLMNYTSPKAKENYRVGGEDTKEYLVKFNTKDLIEKIQIKMITGEEINIDTY